MANICPVIGCDAQLDKPWNLACKGHWFDLPKALRDEVWRLFRAERGSGAHLRSIGEALVFLNTLERERRGEQATIHVG